MLPREVAGWYSPDRGMTDRAKKIFNAFPKLDDIPRLPSSVTRIQQALSDPNSTSEQVAKMMKDAPDIAVNILGLASSLSKKNLTSLHQLQAQYPP